MALKRLIDADKISADQSFLRESASPIFFAITEENPR